MASVVSDISGQSSMSMLRAIVEGNTDPQELSKLAKGSLREKEEALRRALKGSKAKHQRRMLYFTVRHVDELTQLIAQLDEDAKKRNLPASKLSCWTLSPA